MARKPLWWLGVPLAVALAGAAYWLRARPVPVAVIRPQRTDVSVAYSFDGTLRPSNTRHIRSSYAHARVSRFLVQPGEQVQAGQPLAEMDDGGALVKARADVRAARAALRAATDRANTPQRMAKRREQARRRSAASMASFRRKSDAVSKAWTSKRAALQARDRARVDGSAQDLRRAEAALQQATARLSERRDERDRHRSAPPYVDTEVRDAAEALQRAEGELGRARGNPVDPVLRSPVRGQVTALPVNPGQVVARNGVLAEVTDYNSLHALVPLRHVRERLPARPGPFRIMDSPAMRFGWLLYPRYARERSREPTAAIPGADVVIIPRGHTEMSIRGQVQSLYRPPFGELYVDIRLHDAPALLRPDMPVTARIIADRRRDALTVPLTAIRGPWDAPSVLLVRDGCLVRQPVRIAEPVRLDVVVTEGLRDGDLVVKDPAGLTVGRRARPVLAR